MTRTVLLSMRSPRDETGRAFSHAPDSFVEAAKRRERDTASGACFRRVLAMAETFGVSQANDGGKQDQTGGVGQGPLTTPWWLLRRRATRSTGSGVA